MPFFWLKRRTSDKAVKSQSSGTAIKVIETLVPNDHTYCIPPLEITSAEEESTPTKPESPKTVRIDEASLYAVSVPAFSKESSTKSAAKKGPKKSSFARQRSPAKPARASEDESTQLPYGSSITDASSDGYESSRESIGTPSTPATSIASSSYFTIQHREIAHGFEKRISQLPPPPPRMDPNMKISLGHGKDGSRPAFLIASATKRTSSSRASIISRSSRLPRSSTNGD